MFRSRDPITVSVADPVADPVAHLDAGAHRDGDRGADSEPHTDSTLTHSLPQSLAHA